MFDHIGYLKTVNLKQYKDLHTITIISERLEQNIIFFRARFSGIPSPK